MSHLVAVSFPSESRAKEVREQLLPMQRSHLVDLEDAAVVVHRQDGRVQLDQAVDLTARGALGGAFWGTLIGMIFLSPILGMSVGLVSGAIGGALTDIGVDDGFIKDLGRELTPGTSALFILVRRATADKVLEELRPFDGALLTTSLSNEDEEALQRRLEQVREPASNGHEAIGTPS